MEPTITDTPAQASEGVEASTQPVTEAVEVSAETPQEPTNTNQEPEATEPSTDDNSSWLQAKGIDPSSPEAIQKLAEMARNAEKRMHESTTQASELKRALQGDQSEPTAVDLPEEALSNPVVQQLVDKINSLEQGQTSIALATNVNDFFTNNTEARQYEPTMTKMVTDNPTLKALVQGGYLGIDQLYAMAKGSDASRETDLKTAGGKEALERIATKQQGRSVTGKATSSAMTPPATDKFLEGFDSI